MKINILKKNGVKGTVVNRHCHSCIEGHKTFYKYVEKHATFKLYKITTYFIALFNLIIQAKCL